MYAVLLSRLLSWLSSLSVTFYSMLFVGGNLEADHAVVDETSCSKRLAAISYNKRDGFMQLQTHYSYLMSVAV